MDTRDQLLRTRLTAGAAVGAATWLIFATVEYCLWLLAFQFSRSYCSDGSLAWSRELTLFAIYPILGAAVGATAACACRVLRQQFGILVAANGEALLRALALIGIALATSAGVATQIELRGLGRALCVAPLAVAVGVCATVMSAARGHKAGVAGSAVLTSAILLGVPWLATRPWSGTDPRIPVYGCALLYMTFLTAVALRRRAAEPPGQADEASTSPMRRLLQATAAAAAALTFAVYLDATAHLPAPAPERSGADESHPNVILIVLDTARAQNFSLYGYPLNTTPNISRFSREATVYTQAVAPSNYTLSSHASLFTGLLATSHGAHPTHPSDRRWAAGRESGLADRFVTLAEMLSGRGYFTAASIANNLFLSQSYNLDQGFQRFAVLSYRCAAPSPRSLFRKLLTRLSGDSRAPAVWTPYHNAAQVNADAFDLVNTLARRNQRFFLFVNYMDAHFPYAPPPPFDTFFPGKGPNIGRTAYFELRNAVLRGDRTLTAAERRHLLSQYDGALAYLDGEVGRLLGQLRRQHAYDNSLIIITADHGEAFGEKGYVEHGTSTYQDQVHVPLIIRYPMGSRRGVVDDYVSGIDIVPTVLQALGSPPTAEIQGRSLLAADGTSRMIITEGYPRETFRHFGSRFQSIERAIYEGPLKLINSARGGPELYDLRSDPHENRNLYRAGLQESAKLQGRLDAWLAASAKHEGGVPVNDPETLERLRSLGYVK